MTQFSAQPPMQTWSNPPRKPVWPTVIGIIGIVWASLRLICTPVGIVGTLAMKDNAAMPPIPAWYVTFALVGGLIVVGLGIALLIGAIMLLRRKPSARPILLSVAVLEILWLFASVFGNIRLYAEPGWDRPQIAASKFGAFFGLVLAAGWAVFLLVWFLRDAVRREVAAWSKGSPNPYGQ